MDCGIYCLKFPNGQIYVGSSCTIKRRIRQHEWYLECGSHPNDRLQKTYNKYTSFDKGTLLVCQKSQLRFYEQLAINGLDPQLNLSKDAYRPEPTPEVCAKISAAARGRPCSIETRAKMSAAGRGRPQSSATKAKIAASSIGKRMSDEAKAKMSRAKKGKKLSEAHRAKLSELVAKRWAGWDDAKRRAIGANISLAKRG